MAGVNGGRVLLGGLLAGLLMNVGEGVLHGVVLARDTGALYDSLGRSPTPGAGTLGLLVLATFVLGITAVWLYAAMRPRFGPGLVTALYAGLAVWVCAHFFSGAYLWAGFPGLIPPGLAWTPVVWGLVEAPVATMAGAWVYRE